MRNPATNTLRDLLRKNPRASEKEISALMWTAMQSNTAIRCAIFDYWFERHFKRFSIHTTKHTVAVIEKHREIRERGKKIIKAVKEKLTVALMDHVLSNGTLLRFATFGDCRAEGGWLSAVGKLGRANEVIGKKLTEIDLINIRTRNKKAA